MIESYSKLIDSPIVELKTQSKLGVVSDVIIKKSTLSIYGFCVKASSFSLNQKVLSEKDVIQIADGVVVVNDAESLVSLNDVVRLKEALNKGFHGIGQQVVTKSGRRVGKVFDYLFSSSNLLITKFYVKNLFNEKIIPATAVCEIKNRTIILEDDYELTNIPKTILETEMV